MADDFLIDDDAASTTSAGGGDDDQILVTKEGLKKLKEELDHLKTVRRLEVAQRLKEAISYGDLSENSEYEEAKNEQAFVEGRIIELENKVKNARLITDKKKVTTTQTKLVEIGSSVTVVNKGENDEPITYTIVGSTEADPNERRISNECPLGKSFLGRKRGDIVDVQTPSGKKKYEIVKVG